MRPFRATSKYRNKKTVVDGILFDSKREAARYCQLKMAEKSGIISKLQRQVNYPLVVNGIKIGSYRADFCYVQGEADITEDVKGMKTREYILKRKLMLALYGIAVKET